MPADDTTSTQARPIDPAVLEAIWRRQAAAKEAPWLHQEVARRMAERLQIIKLQPATLVEWDGFAGGSDALLANAYPKARRLITEPTPALQQRSRESLKSSWWSPARWTGPSVEVIGPADLPRQSAQLLWSNMSLHGAIDPPAVLQSWQQALEVDGFVMFSCFGPDTARELRRIYRALEWPAPTIDFVDMHDLGDMMVHAGFADPVMDQESLTLTWATPEALLSELRTLGANASPGRFAGLRGRRWRERLHDALASSAQPDGRIALTFEVAYGHAFKAPVRVKGAAETTVSLDDMRSMVRGSVQGTRHR